MLFHQSKLFCYRRIDLTGDLTSKYTFYLCFSVKYKTHKLVHYHNLKYSEKQKKLHDLIQSLHESGMGYRKIAKLLNTKKIKTIRGNLWESNQVYAILKRYKERLQRLEFINKEYEMVWSRMKIKYELN